MTAIRTGQTTALFLFCFLTGAANAQYYPSQVPPAAPPAYAQPGQYPNAYPPRNAYAPRQPVYGQPATPAYAAAPQAPQLPANYASAPPGSLNQVPRPTQYSTLSTGRTPPRPCPSYMGCPDNRSYVGWSYSVPGALVSFMQDRCQRIDQGMASVKPGQIWGSSTVSCSFYHQ